jgi:hypothetical protein
VEKTLRGGCPLTLLRRGWAPTKTARTKSISTAGTISLKTTPNAPALERRRCFAAARPLGIRRKRGVVREVELLFFSVYKSPVFFGFYIALSVSTAMLIFYIVYSIKIYRKSKTMLKE